MEIMVEKITPLEILLGPGKHRTPFQKKGSYGSPPLYNECTFTNHLAFKNICIYFKNF